MRVGGTPFAITRYINSDAFQLRHSHLRNNKQIVCSSGYLKQLAGIMLSVVCKLFVVLMSAAVVLGQYGGGGYGGGAGGYGGGGGGYGGGHGGGYNYGPDNALYYYNTYHYDPYFYKDANVKFNRYPGGAAYTVNEYGKGSNVNVNVETYRAGYKGY